MPVVNFFHWTLFSSIISAYIFPATPYWLGNPSRVCGWSTSADSREYRKQSKVTRGRARQGRESTCICTSKSGDDEIPIVPLIPNTSRRRNELKARFTVQFRKSSLLRNSSTKFCNRKLEKGKGCAFLLPFRDTNVYRRVISFIKNFSLRESARCRKIER